MTGPVQHSEPSGPLGGGLRPPADDRIAVEISLHALGRTLTAAASLPRRASLADMVPPARDLADALSRLRTDRQRAAGGRVSCRRGCAACCRYAVPLSVPEAFCLQDDLQTLPNAPRARLQLSLHHAAGRLLAAVGASSSDGAQHPAGAASSGGAQHFAGAASSGGAQHFAGAASSGGAQHPAGAALPDTAEDLSRWYAGLDLPCPFLAGDCCEVYSWRPIACREHLAASPPALCRGHSPRLGRLVDLPVSLTDALGLLAAEVEGTDVEAVFLPLAEPWWSANAPRAARRWPAEHLAATLTDILTALATRSAAA